MKTPTFRKFRTRSAMSQTVNKALNFILLKCLLENNRASLMLSGGSTPIETYQLLSEMPVRWQEVDIGLVDDRWVDETDPGSNAAMIRQTLLRNRALKARFHPLKIQFDPLIWDARKPIADTVIFRTPLVRSS